MKDRQLIEAAINAIESVSLQDLHKYPKLELVLPMLHEALIIEDECIHAFNNQGICICGATVHDK